MVYMDIFLSIVLYGFYLVDKVSVVDNRASKLIIKHRIFFFNLPLRSISQVYAINVVMSVKVLNLA